MLRENWSKTMISASLPNGCARHSYNSHCTARSCTAPNLSTIWWSKSGFRPHHWIGSTSANQKSMTFWWSMESYSPGESIRFRAVWCGKHCQNAGVAVEVMPRDLATGKEPDQGYVAQRLAHDLQLGVPRTEVGAAAARAADIKGARHVTGGTTFHFVPDFRRDAHQIELGGFCIARAKGQAHTGLDQLGDRQDLV